MIVILLVIFLCLCSADIPLKFSTITNGTLLGYGTFNTYSFNPQFSSFEVNIWRTSSYTSSGSVPSVKVTLTPPVGQTQTVYGKVSISSPYSGNYTVTVLYEDFSLSTYTYQIRVCKSSCPASCPFTLFSGYCNNMGACNYNNRACKCDNTTSALTTGCEYNYDFAPVVGAIAGIYIALIVVGVLVVCVIPIVVCICCFGCCGLCAYNAAVASTQPAVIHVHSPPTTSPQYVQVPNPQGVQYYPMNQVPNNPQGVQFYPMNQVSMQ